MYTLGARTSSHPWMAREGTHLQEQVRELSEHGKVEPFT